MYVIGQEEADAVRRVIESKQLFRYRGGEGGETDQFEAEWAEKIGVKYALTVTSGTAGLMCALAGLGLELGDQVIVPAHTWMATAVAPLPFGAIPILAEVDETLTLDAADVERKITPRTKAIMPVHMNGFPSNMDAIMDVAGRHGLKVVEDACQACGGAYKGRRLGSIGHAGAFSFNQFKVISCGEAGATVTNDPDIYHWATMYHDAGCIFAEAEGKAEVPFYAGMNFRTNEILTAILRVQAGRLDGILEGLRKRKRILLEAVAGVEAFRPNPSNDAEGDCGTTLPLLFEEEKVMRAFLEQAGEKGIASGTPIDGGRHVYVNWEPILEKRGAANPSFDPYKLCGYEVEYTKDMCPRTLEYLGKTAYVGVNLEWTEEEAAEAGRTLATCV